MKRIMLRKKSENYNLWSASRNSKRWSVVSSDHVWANMINHFYNCKVDYREFYKRSKAYRTRHSLPANVRTPQTVDPKIDALQFEWMKEYTASLPKERQRICKKYNKLLDILIANEHDY